MTKSVIVVGVDDSKESFYPLEWTLDHLLIPTGTQSASPFKLIILHTVLSILQFSSPGTGDVHPMVESDLKKIATPVLEKAKELCHNKSITDFETELCEGDTSNVLCKAVEKHHADMLVVGSHGYSIFKRVILGSVSDYCAHHAHCSVLIVKKPKIKH